MRKTIAKRMTESFRDIPHFPLCIDIEIDGLLKARGDINKRFADSGVKISVNDMCIKAAALALKMVPESNASYTPDGIAQHHHCRHRRRGGDSRRADHADHLRRRDQGPGANLARNG